MTDPQQGPKSGGLSLYFIFSMACGAVLALASVAFRADGEIAGRLYAKGLNGSDKIAAVHAAERLAALNGTEMRGDGVMGRKQTSPAELKLNAQVPPPVHVIARVDDTGDVAATEARQSPPVGSDEDELASATPWVPPKGQTYRTVCVRLCDGAMVPVSFSTRRSRFLVDAERCAQQCGSPSMLFVYPTTGSQDDMVDLEGRAYRDLPTAYKFRTDYDAVCGCRAQPWETAALDQHRAWALAQSVKPTTGAATPQPPTLAQLDVPTAMPEASLTHLKGALAESAVVATLDTAPPQPSKPEVEVAKPDSKLSIGAVKTSPPAASTTLAAVALPKPKSKAKRQPQLAVVADVEPSAVVPLVRSKVAKKGVVVATVVVAKVKMAKPARLIVAAGRPEPRSGQNELVRVADVVSHRKWGSQRSFRGDDWRISVWEPR
jgi:Protein of unknown function (DUF2865)